MGKGAGRGGDATQWMGQDKNGLLAGVAAGVSVVNRPTTFSWEVRYRGDIANRLAPLVHRRAGRAKLDPILPCEARPKPCELLSSLIRVLMAPFHDAPCFLPLVVTEKWIVIGKFHYSTLRKAIGSTGDQLSPNGRGLLSLGLWVGSAMGRQMH